MQNNYAIKQGSASSANTAKSRSWVLSLWLLLCLIASSATVFGQNTSVPGTYGDAMPTVTSDKDDYSPGETAIISGSGWTLDQYVDVHLEEEPAHDHHHGYHDTQVNSDGTWRIEYPIEERHLGVKFTVVVDGKQSGAKAYAYFTDGPGDVTITSITPNFGPYNVSTSVSITGSNFFSDNGQTGTNKITYSYSVTFGSSTVTATRTTSTTLTASAPTQASAIGKVDVTVTRIPNKTEANSSDTKKNGFDYQQATITSTNLAVTAASGTYGGTITLSATLTSGSPATGVNAKKISFTLNGASAGSAITNTSGVATLSNVSLAGINAGAYATGVGASFAGDASYSSINGSNSLTVNKATTTIALSNLEHTYNGSAKTVGVTTSPAGLSGVSITYDGSTIAPTNAGSYDVVATLTNANYQAEDATGTLVIAKANQTITFDGPYNKTYGDDPFTLDATASSGLDVSYASSNTAVATVLGNSVTIVGAGTTTITATQSGNDNYNAATSVSQELTVNKASQTISWSNPADIVYGTALGNAQLNASLITGDGALTYTPASGTVLNAGTHTLKVDAAATDNYNAASKTVSITVNKATPTISWTPNPLAAISYGTALTGKLNATASFDGNTVAGSFIYKIGDDVVTSATKLDAASSAYTIDVTFTPTDDDNYNSSTGSNSITVNKATANIDVTVGGPYTYDNTAKAVQSATVTGVGDADLGNATVIYKQDGNTVTPINAGSYDVFASYDGNSNYEAIASSKVATLTIGKATTTTTVTVSNGTYNGSTQGGSASVTGAGGLNHSLTVSYEGTGSTPYGPSTTAPTNAGTYNATATYAESANYLTSTDTKSFTINKAMPVVTASAASNLVYDATAKAGSGKATGVGGLNDVLIPAVSLSYLGTGSTIYGPSANAPVNAGTYTITASFAGNNNYVAGTSSAVAFTINPQMSKPMSTAYYTGSSFFWTTGSNSSTATLNLAATLKNSINYGGDIRTARLSFFVRNGDGTCTPINGAQNLPVGLVNADDLTVGTSAVSVQYNIGNSTAAILNIAVKVTGNYKSDESLGTDKCITVAVPLPGGQIAGGGDIDGVNAAGLIKGSSNVSFFVKYNSSLTNPQGGVEIKVFSYYDRNGKYTPAQLHTYRIKSTAISGLSVGKPAVADAQFSGKANVAEIVNGVEQSIEGNCTMQLSMSDKSSTGIGDLLAVTVNRSKGGIWFSSSWDGSKTVLKAIVSNSGNIAVRSSSNSTARMSAEEEVTLESNVVTVSPNPFEDRVTVDFGKVITEDVVVTVMDTKGAVIYQKNFKADSAAQVEVNLSGLNSGVYYLQSLHGKERKVTKIVKF